MSSCETVNDIITLTSSASTTDFKYPPIGIQYLVLPKIDKFGVMPTVVCVKAVHYHVGGNP